MKMLSVLFFLFLIVFDSSLAKAFDNDLSLILERQESCDKNDIHSEQDSNKENEQSDNHCHCHFNHSHLAYLTNNHLGKIKENEYIQIIFQTNTFLKISDYQSRVIRPPIS